jgi:hypothetical protein
MCTAVVVSIVIAAAIVWSKFWRQVLLTVAILYALIAYALISVASAQRCPAGHDQFLNCLPLSGAARTRHEQWSNQPVARQIPGAQPYGAAPTTGMNPCVYRLAARALQTDPRGQLYRAAVARAGGTREAADAVRDSSPEAQALRRDLFRRCGARL